VYPGRRRRVEGRGGTVPCGWPGSGDGGAGARAAGCHRKGDGEDTGQPKYEATAGGGLKKECPAPCSGSTAAALIPLHAPGPAPGPVAGAAVPVGSMGVGAEGRRFPTAGRQWRWRRGGSRWTQGRGDGRAPRAGGLGEPGKKEVCLRLAPGVRIKGSGRSPP